MRNPIYNLRRNIRFWWQRRTRGWDDSVTWNLDQQIAAWLAPRLRRFRELNGGFSYGITAEQWDAEVDEMVWAAEWYAEHAYDINMNPQDMDRALRGLQQVTVRLNELWC